MVWLGSAMQAVIGQRVAAWLAGTAGVLGLLFLGIYNQPYYPTTWLDEGFVLQGPLNLVRYGQYAMKSVEGFRVLDQPLIANGPGVVLPITAAFVLFGPGLLQARLVMVAFLVLATLLYFTVARRLYGRFAAFLSTLLLLAVPAEGFLQYGRQVLGIVPALAYFLLGYLFWLTAIKRHSWRLALSAGLLFGLAMITKGQYGLLILVMILVGLAERLYYRIGSLKVITVVILAASGCLAIWYGVQLWLVGWANFDQHLVAIRASSRVTVFACSPLRLPRNFWYLLRAGLPLFVLPGLLYAAWSCRRRTVASLQKLILVIFVLVWLIWYVVASTGWHRYAFEGYAIGLLFAGKFIVDTFDYLKKPGKYSGWNRSYLRVTVLLLVAAILIGGILDGAYQVRLILASPDTSLQSFADYLRHHISPQAVVESWEWQIDPLVDLAYHHPPNSLVDQLTAIDRYHEDIEINYDPFEHHPDYLIDGPWSKAWDLYTPYLAAGCCTQVLSIDTYDLYKVKPTAIE